MNPNDPNPPESPSPPSNPILTLTHTSTAQILRHSTTLTLTPTHLPTLLTLSLLLFTFRTFIETGTLFLTTALDRDPTIKSLLSSLSPPPPSPHSLSSPPPPKLHSLSSRRPRRPPSSFLHLSRVSTLTDDLLDNPTNFPHSPPVPNSSFLLPWSFHTLHFSLVDPGPGAGPGAVPDPPPAQDPRFIFAGLELTRRDAMVLFSLILLLAAAYGWVIIGYVITYSWCLGTVFVSTTSVMLSKAAPLLQTLWAGSSAGTKRLSGFVLMRWAVRDAITQVIGLYYFGEVEDQFSFFKVFLRLKLLPFSVSSSTPSVSGYDTEISGFLLAWFVVDTVVGFVFTVDSWVTMVNARRGGGGGGGGREIVKEGCFLLGIMMKQSIQIKCLELILSGAFTRWCLARLFGRAVAVLFQSLVEVYFMVVWLVYYFAAKSKDAALNGRRFGRRELEGIMEGLR